MRSPNVLVVSLCLSMLFVFAADAMAQTPQEKAHAARLREIRRHNYAQEEAIRLLFGRNGIPALTRPIDPYNRRPRYIARPYHATQPRIVR